MSWRLQRPAWAAATAAIALRAGLMAAYPALFGGDSVVRLANADRVFLSYQLPALQAVIHALWLVAPGQWAVRAFLALASGVAAAGVFRMAGRLMPERAALAVALLFALNPFLAAYSIVPYQEMMMLAGLSWAFAWALEERVGPAAVALALACLTRYEAWLACPAIVWILWRGGEPSIKRLAWLTALCAAAPLGWMLYHSGLTPAGAFAVEGRVSVERVWRWAYLGWITVKFSWFALPAAGLGAWRVARERRWREPGWQGLLGFGALFAVGILLSAHGERDQPERFVTAREAHLPLAFVCVLAGYGVAKLGGARDGVVLAMLALSLVSAQRFVAEETAEPHVALARQAAGWLDERLAPGETAVVLAKPVPADMLERFLATAERQGGAAGRLAALRVLEGMHAEPPDYQRILVQTRFGRDRVASLARLPGEAEPAEVRPTWAVVWPDFEASSAAERAVAAALEGAAPAGRLEAADVSIRLYHLSR